ncbi:Superoxide dismutase (Cu-Zn) [Planktothrix serta PCC 8927]|uniref:Superoxide dismutase (Cu-Zn) n=1 Tax=Planktothrix serta PCC 8927 TaxID=671068 RepID=A0A7Z9E4A1_9CYAN|nr:superoxide dismutase family protein [Planktothrix serta]VXD25910.1 Superoxide dismutase (Cu-Zn) [Planktothrix serta PCC 8927]
MAILKRMASIFCGCVLILVFLASCTQNSISLSNNSITAQAGIQGTSESNLSGTVTLTQIETESILPLIEVKAEISGLPPNTKHGFHIHQKGSCEPDFNAAGGHFDPGPYGETNADANHPFHMGDLPNLVADANGKALLNYTTNRVSLSPGPLSLFDQDGSAIIVHVDEDKGTTGVKGGAGGGRLGCGVIKLNA